MVTRVSGTSKRRKKACPKCGSADVVPILYGYPTSKLFEDAEKGKVALGGCCVSGDDPQMLCRACGEEFDRPGARAPESPGREPRKRARPPAG